MGELFLELDGGDNSGVRSHRVRSQKGGTWPEREWDEQHFLCPVTYLITTVILPGFALPVYSNPTPTIHLGFAGISDQPKKWELKAL
jgi:hypothetical protein